MNGNANYAVGIADSFDRKMSISSLPGNNALSNRVTSVLSASYADTEIRDALDKLDKMGIENTPEIRRRLRLDVQKEVIDCNGAIVNDFGHVAEVRQIVLFDCSY